MTREIKYSKKAKTSSKNANPAKKKKRNEESDSDDNYDDDDDESSTSDDEEEEEEMDVHEYRKFLKKIFPSKNLDNKIEAGEKLKKASKSKNAHFEEEETTKKKSKSSKSKNPEPNPKSKSKSKGKKVKYESESESDSEYSEEEECETDDEEEKIRSKKNANKFNIIFTIGGKDEDEEDEDDEDWEDADDDDNETEDENESVSSVSSCEDDEDDEDEDEDDDDEHEDEDEDEEVTEEKCKRKSTKKQPKKIQLKKGKKDKQDVTSDSQNESEQQTGTNLEENEKLLVQLNEMYVTNKTHALKEHINVCEKKIKELNKKKEKKVQKQKAKHGRIFKKIIRDKNTMNDFTFFEKLEVEQQKKIIGEVREINKISRIEKPYRMTLLEANIPTNFKAEAIKKINSLRYMEPGSGEYYKIKNWVDTFMRLPFGKYENLPVNIDDGVEKCHEFMETAKNTLDAAVYGLNDAKMQIMQMLGQLITNPNAIGTAIAIQGPPGTGKTSLVKEGISKILNRPFAFLALGGATDSSHLEGHSYTYEGSTWGKIVQILIESRVMNPVIYFDELDKISDTPKGEEITGILTHLTDTTQNSEFHDKYFAEIDFDLSKCLFIFSYNDESKINPILRDRMYRIHTKGYDRKQKTIICNQYLLPRIREQVKFNNGEIIIPDEIIGYIIENHCNKEDGVRNMKRCLEIIHTKINLYRLMKPGSNLFEEDMSLNVEFPFTITIDIVDKLIKKPHINMSFQSMYL